MFPSLDEMLLNPAAAAAIVVILVNAISYAVKAKPTWLAIVVSLVYMIGGYLVTGRTAPDQLFLAAIYALLIITPLAHVDASIVAKLFGSPKTEEMRTAGEPDTDRQFFQPWW